MGFHVLDNLQNQGIKGERKIIVDRIRVKRRPDMAAHFNKIAGTFGTPVHVIVLFTIIELDKSETKAMWPCNLPSQGMWFATEEEWEQQEARFHEEWEKEKERLRWVTYEKADNITTTK